MAVNNTRSMSAEFHQGYVDPSYMHLTPDRGGVVEHPPVERMSWPTYRQVEQHPHDPMSCGCYHPEVEMVTPDQYRIGTPTEQRRRRD